MSDKGDPMDVSQPVVGDMHPPAASEPRASEPPQEQSIASVNGLPHQPVGAAAAAQQPKIVQTAFIHKLYNMLEDMNIQHLISWSSSNESFVMSPSSEFSKVLAQYFKHTNISSFVRQLNMYGFHKVSDVFHTGSPDAPLWEFKHGAGSFKRGDLNGLREIKRRASRHALIHRDSFSSTPKVPLPPQPPVPPLDTPHDPLEVRLSSMEWHQQDLNARLARIEDAYTTVTGKCQTLLEGLTRCHAWNRELASSISAAIPDSGSHIQKDLSAIQQEISRGIDSLRSLEDSHDPFTTSRPPAYAPAADQGIMSPRQRPFDESRRPSLQNISRSSNFRNAVPSHLQSSPRRYGSIGNANSTAYSPSSTSTRTFLPPPPLPPMQPAPQQHPLVRPQSPPPNLARRHTSADIRVQGWQGGQMPPYYNQNSSPYASGQNSSAWPSSPRTNPADQQIRDALAQYELPRPINVASSRQASPPAAPGDSTPLPPTFTNSFGSGSGAATSISSYANTSNDAGWQLPGAKYPFRGLETPGPPTRRSSMASNVHSLLNPADTAEKEGEDEVPDDRKRKRVL